jgi:glycerol kinase
VAPRYVLALDQGTTSSRALVFDAAGAIAAVAQREVAPHFPAPGRVEHDPDEIWSSQIEVAAEALSRAGAGPDDVATIGITNQRETTIVWERATGRPVSRAIVWQDRRTAAACDALRRSGIEPEVRAKTGLLLDPYFSATKIAWILDHVPGARARAGRGELAFGTVDAWLVWNLTRGALHATDATNASRTLLYDIRRGVWDEGLLGAFGVPGELLPQVRGSSEVWAETGAGLPIPAGIPVAGVAGDQQAALFGQRCVRPGMAKNTYGTGCFVVLATGERVVRTETLLATIATRRGARVEYALEGSIFIGGAVVQWLRDQLGLVRTAAEIEPLAASVPDSGGVVLVPAFAGLGAPHWDPAARGAILGLTRGTSAAHIARAALESIALQVADVMEAMHRDSGIALDELRVDGGAAANDLLMQLQADVLGIPVVRPANAEATAQGAAWLAGLAVGFWKDEATIDAQWRAARRFEPAMTASRRAELVSAWRRGVERAARWEIEP